MRADRLLSLLLLLQTRGRLKAAELAERLEVSERTIYRDLDALSAAGVPVYAERGPGGGCILRPGYRTDLTGLNAAEVASLFAGTSGRVLDAVGFGEELQQALIKLEAALPASRRQDAARIRDRLHVDAAAWFVPSEATPYLAPLRDAVFANQRVRLTYVRTDGRAVKRVVDPLGLVVKGGVWYLVAANAGDIHVFRTSRVRHVHATGDRFERPLRFDLAAFWGQWSRRFVASIPEYWTTLRIGRRAVALLPQVLGERVRPTLEAAQPTRAGSVTINLSFDSLEAACGNLLRMGGLVEVLEPAELRAALQRTAAEVVQLYAERGPQGTVSVR